MTYDKNRPVSSIKHGDKRVAIPDSAHQGEEQMAISGMPEQSKYDIFRRHNYVRTSEACISMRTSAQKPSLIVSMNCMNIRAKVPSCNSTYLETWMKNKKMNWIDWLATTSIATIGRID